MSITLEDGKDSFHHLRVSKVEQMETELRQIREWLDDLIEDELEFTPEFERSIQDAERDITAGSRSG